MPALAAIVYLILALRVRIGLNASLTGVRGSIAFTIGMGSVYLRFDGEIRKKDDGVLLMLVPRYGKASSSPRKKKEKTLRRIKAFLWLVRTGRMERLSLHARIGCTDAGETAVAAGCLRAAAAALFSALDSKAMQEVRVVPDFDAAGFCAQLRCIFSCQAGDIMLAAIKAAFEKSRREGLGWKSIPLRA